MRIKWFEFCDHHRRRKPWSVWFVDQITPAPGREDRLTKLSDMGAATDSVRRTIEIRADCSRKEYLECISHELLHVSMSDEGGHQTPRQYRAEEYVARCVECSLLCMMESLGATFPPVPRGLRSLRLRAKRIADDKTLRAGRKPAAYGLPL